MYRNYFNQQKKEEMYRMKKYHIERNTVQETLMIPLYGRALATQHFPDIFHDEDAVRIVEEIDYNFSRTQLTGFSNALYGLRQQILAEQAKSYLQNHPDGVIINLGCGFDTSFSMVDNGQCRFVNLDFDEVIESRMELLPEKEREWNFAHDAMDFSWMKKLKEKFPQNSRNVYTICGGVLYYFKPEQVRSLLGALAENFPGGGICFDCENSRAVAKSNRLVQKSGNTGSMMYFAVDDAENLFRSWNRSFKNIRVMDQLSDKYKGLPLSTRLIFHMGLKMGMFKFVEITW